MVYWDFDKELLGTVCVWSNLHAWCLFLLALRTV